MNKRYRLGEIEEAVAEMEERIDIEVSYGKQLGRKNMENAGADAGKK